jgi:hypothetical protein
MNAYVNLKHAALVVAKLRKLSRAGLQNFDPDSPTLGPPAKMLLRRIADSKDPPPTFAEKLLAVARAEIGIKEWPAGSNDGPRVHVFQSATGAYHQPWCASFVTWALLKAGYEGPWPPNKAYVPSWVGWARARKLTVKRPRAGDLVCYDWQHDRIPDHIGIVEKATETGAKFSAIEGNTAVGNDSNGGEVMRRERTRSQVACFIRLKVGG